MRAPVAAAACAAALFSHPADRHAWHRLVDEHGVVRLDAEYSDGVRDGVYRTWYPDGRRYEVRHYANGREEGLQQAWAPDGELFVNYEMRDGRRYGLVNAKPCQPVREESR